MAYGARRRPSDGIHKAVEGDTISSIAASYGFTDWEEKVWNAGENANLKTERENPNELVPGDEVFIPELEQKQEARPTDEWHDFHVVRNKRHLRLKLQNENGEPLANKAYQITPDESFRGTYVQQKQTTDADGMIDEEIPHTLLEAVLTLPDENLRARLMIGYLQPIPMGEPVSAPALDVGGALGGLGGGLADAVGGAIDFSKALSNFTVVTAILPASVKRRSKLKSRHATVTITTETEFGGDSTLDVTGA